MQKALHCLSLCYAYNNEHLCVTSGFRCGLSEIWALRCIATFRDKVSVVYQTVPVAVPRGNGTAVHCTGGCVDPVPVWTGEENLVPTGIRTSGRPARGESLYLLSYPAPTNVWTAEVTQLGEMSDGYSLIVKWKAVALWMRDWENTCRITGWIEKFLSKILKQNSSTGWNGIGMELWVQCRNGGERVVFWNAICHRGCDVAFIADCDVNTYYLVTYLPTYLVT